MSCRNASSCVMAEAPLPSRRTSRAAPGVVPPAAGAQGNTAAVPLVEVSKHRPGMPFEGDGPQPEQFGRPLDLVQPGDQAGRDLVQLPPDRLPAVPALHQAWVLPQVKEGVTGSGAR